MRDRPLELREKVRESTSPQVGTDDGGVLAAGDGEGDLVAERTIVFEDVASRSRGSEIHDRPAPAISSPPAAERSPCRAQMSSGITADQGRRFDGTARDTTESTLPRPTAYRAGSVTVSSPRTANSVKRDRLR